MKDIQSALPRSYDLRYKIPHFEGLLLGAPRLGTGIAEQWGGLRLVDGWHMLNEARIALIEAEACRVFYEYEEVRPDPTEAKYRSRFYLDDAALRLYSSCEHLLKFVIAYWNLSLTKGTRKPLLVRVIQAVEGSAVVEARREVARALRGLRSSNDWAACTKYRNDWVHNKIPGIAGLNYAVSFGRLDENDLALIGKPWDSERGHAPRRGTKITFGIGRDIGELRRTVRSAYRDLYRVYEALSDIVGRDRASTGGKSI